MELILLGLAALFAGFVDAIVGGGGLVLVPALFSAFPDTTPATLFGTNKAGAIWGTSASMWSYGLHNSVIGNSMTIKSTGYGGVFCEMRTYADHP